MKGVALAAACLLGVGLAPATLRAQDVAITGATAWTMTADRPVENATIVVRDGRIASIERGGAVPPGVPEVRVDGATVTPGLFNAATQIGLVELSSVKATIDRATVSDRLGAGFDPSYALNGNSTVVPLARADGLTGALVFPGASAKEPFSGLAATATLREGANILDRPRAALVAVIGGGAWQKQSGSRAAQWQVLIGRLDHARKERGEEKGDDKRPRKKRKGGPPGPGPGRGGEDPDREAIEAVLAARIPLMIFTDRESDIRQAIALTREFKLRTIIAGGAQAWRVADELAAAKIAVVVTPSADLPSSFDELATRSDNAAILARAGVEVAFGQAGGVISSTFNAGIALREDAGIAVANGMARADAWRAITVTPRALFGTDGDDGTLAAGRKATFVVWDGDPLEPSTLAQAVYIDGRRTSLETRQDLLARRYLGK